MNALGRGIIAARVGTAALNAASVPPRQLARPVSIVPNIPGIPGPPSSSSGSVSPPGLPVHSEAKMVSVAPHPLRPLRSARAAPSTKAFFPRDFCQELLRNQSPVPGWDRLSVWLRLCPAGGALSAAGTELSVARRFAQSCGSRFQGDRWAGGGLGEGRAKSRDAVLQCEELGDGFCGKQHLRFRTKEGETPLFFDQNGGLQICPLPCSTLPLLPSHPAGCLQGSQAELHSG